MFTRRPAALRILTSSIATLAMLVARSAYAANDLYWDTNGFPAGSAAATGTWGTSNFWSDNSAGTFPSSFQFSTANLNDLHFSAGSNGSAGTVTVSGAVSANSIVFEESASLTLSGGTSITLGGGGGVNPGVFVAANVTSANTISTPLILGSAQSIQTFGTGLLSIQGGVSGNFDLSLSANSTGGITVSTAPINNSGTLTNSGTGTGTVTLNSVIGSGVTELIQNSRSSGLILNGATANAYTGPTTIQQGNLTLDFANLATPTNLVSSSSALRLRSGTLNVTGQAGAAATSQTFASTTVLSGAAAILGKVNGGAGTTINLGALTVPAASTLLVGAASGTTTANLTITTLNDKDATGIYGSRTVFANGTAGSGYDWATTASATAPYTLSAYTDYTPLVAGATTDNLNATTGSLSLTGDHTHNTLKITSGAGLALGSNRLTLSNGGLLSTGTAASTISGTTGATRLTAGSASGYELIVHQYNNHSSGLAISAVIGDNGANPVSFTYSGTGVLTLNAANTYTGVTTLNGFSVNLQNADALGATTAGTTVNSGAILALQGPAATVFAAEPLTLNGGILRASSGTSATWTGPINLTADSSMNTSGVSLTVNSPIDLGSSTLSVDTSGATFLFSNTISGTGSLIKTGTNVLTLSGNNTYTGKTTLSGAGTLTVSSLNRVSGGSASSSLGAPTTVANGTIDLTGGARLRYTGAGETTDRVINLAATTSAGTIENAGTGLLKFANAFTATGLGNKTLTLDGITAGEIAGAVVNSTGGTTGITKTGTGAWTLSGANTYTGGTTVSSGTLNLTGSLSGSGISINGASAAFNESTSGVISGASTLTLTLGSALLAGANTYTGATTITNGTLTVGIASVPGVSGALGNGSAITIGTAATAVLNLNDFDTQIGALTASAGSGNINLGAATLTISTGTNATYSGTIQGAGGLTKNGASVQTLSPATPNTYTGATTVIGGTLLVDFANATDANNLLSSSSPVVLSGGTLQVKSKNTINTAQAFAGVTLNAGAATISATNTGTETLAVALGNISRSVAASTVNFILPATGNLTTSKNNDFSGILGTWATTGTGTTRQYATVTGGIIVGYAGSPAASAADVTDLAGNVNYDVAAVGALAGGSGASVNTLRYTGAAGTISGPLGANGIMNAGTGTLSLSGPLTIGASKELIVNMAAASVTISGAISDNAGGPSAIVAAGGNTLTLSNANNAFTGGVYASASSISVASDAHLGAAASPVNLLNNGTLAFSGSSVLNPLRSISLTNGGRISPSTQNNIPGTISGASPLTISSSNGNLLLSGNNSFPSMIFGGMVRVSSEANLGGPNSALSSNNSVFFTHGFSIMGTALTNLSGHAFSLPAENLTLDIQDPNNTFTWDKSFALGGNSASATAFVKSGPGTVVFTAPQTYTNQGTGTGIATAINGGVLKIDQPAGGSLAQVGVNANNRVSLGGGTLHILGKPAVSTSQNIGHVKLTSGASTLLADNNHGSGTTALNVGNFDFFANTPGGTLNIRTINPGTGAASVTTSQINDISGIVGAGRITFDGSNWATSTGAGANIAAYSAYTTLPVSGSSNLVNYRQIGAGSVDTTEIVNTLKLSGANDDVLSIASGQTLGISAAGLLYTGGSLPTDNYSISGGTLSSYDLVIHHQGAGKLTIDSTIANVPAAAAHAGTTANASAVITGLDSTADLMVGQVVNGPGVSGGTIKSIDSATQITLNANAGASSGAGSFTFGAAPANLTKTGPGTLVLTAANTYSGQTYINGGVLSISAISQLSSGALNINGGTLQTTLGISTNRAVALGGNGGAFDVADNQTLTLSGVVSGWRLTVANTGTGSGTLLLSGNNTFGGGIELQSGTLKQGSAGALNSVGLNTVTFAPASAARLQLNGFNSVIAGLTSTSTSAIIENGSASPSTLSVYNGGDNNFAGVLRDGGTGALGLKKGGGAVLNLLNDNLYTGPTAVEGGALIISGTLTGTASINVQSGATLGGAGMVTLATADTGDINLFRGAKFSPGYASADIFRALFSGGGEFNVSLAVAPANSQSLVFQLGTPASSDKLMMAGGVLNIGDGLLSFDDFAFTPESGFGAGTYMLFDTDTAIAGSLALSDLTGSIGGLPSTLALANGDRDVVLIVVPEPTSVVSLMSGLGLLLGCSRRRKQQDF